MSHSNADKLRNNPKWYNNKNWFSFLFQGVSYHFPGMIMSVITMMVVTAFLAFLQVEYKLITFNFPHFFHPVLG